MKLVLPPLLFIKTMYTTIIHPIRKAHRLSCNEYVILDTIYHLSHNDKYGGWCVASKKQLSKWLDISERTIFRSIEVLLTKELIIKDEKTGWIRTTDMWNEQIANKNDWLLGFEGKEIQYLSGNVKKKNGRRYDKLAEGVCQNGRATYDKMSYYNNKDNNIDNNNNSINRIKAEPQSYGNEEINNMILALKGKIGIEDFADSQKWNRIYAKHCVSLISKIGKEEFVRRLDILLNDSFHSKNMNKIKYVYNNIKGFKEPVNNLIKL